MELDPDLYTVAWIAPLEIEARAALHMLDNRHMGQFPWSYGYDYLFHAGDINGHNVILATLPSGQVYGTSSAAALASQIKTFFPNIRFGLLVGVAAGLPNFSQTPYRDIRLGDVLVGLPDGESAGLIAYDLGKETKDGFQPLRCGHMLATTESIVRAAIGNIKLESPNDIDICLPFYETIKHKEHANGTFIDPGQDRDKLYEVDEYGFENLVNRERRPDSRRARVWYGSIGSGEKLIKNPQKRNELRDRYNVIGLEMEAAGTMNHIPVGVIRGVCDYGDDHKSKEWQPYAAAMAAAYAKAVLYQIYPKTVPMNQRAAAPSEMDAISTVNASSSILGLLDMVSRSITVLADLQRRYKSVSLKIKLLIGQLSTLKAALAQINELLDLLPCGGIAQDSQLSKDVAQSLDCCDAVMSVLDERLAKYRRDQLTVQSKTRFVLSENDITEFQSLLNTQVNALNLLLTAMQCKSVIEQSNFLRRAENRSVFNQVKDYTSSLLWLRDSESEITKKSSVAENLDRIDANFSFDPDLFSSRVYRSAAMSTMEQALRVTVTQQWVYNEIEASADDGFSIMTDQETRDWRRIDVDNNEKHLFSAASVSESQRQRANSIKSDPGSTRSSIRPQNWVTTTTSIQRQMGRQTERLGIQQLSNVWFRRQSRIQSAKAPLPQETATETLHSRVLLAGSSRSGKSTAVKAINLLLGIDSELGQVSEKFTILAEVNEQIKNLWAANMTLPDEHDLSLAQSLKRLWPLGEQGVSSDENHSARALWDALKDSGLLDKETLSSFSDGAEYFFDSTDRITNPEYIPSFQDSMWVYTTSTGIALSRYTNGPVEVIICDPGGSRSERRKWGDILDKATTILYFVDAGSYDQVSPEADDMNRIEEDLVLFESLCNARLTAKANIVLFIHKIDKLERKLGTIPFDRSVIECPIPFSGDPHSLKDVMTYLRDAFLAISIKAHRNVPVKFTSLRDPEEFGRLVLSYALPRKKS